MDKGCSHLRGGRGEEGGREEVSSNVDKSGQGKEWGLAESGRPFQCGLCWRKEDA